MLPQRAPLNRSHACLALAGLLPALLWASAPGGKRPQDEVRLADGRVVVGHVKAYDEHGVTLSGGGRTQHFARGEVAELLSPLTLMGELAEREAAARQQGGGAWLELMRWCAQSGLEREASLAALRVLNENWEQPEAKAQWGILADGADYKLRLGRARLGPADLFTPLGPWRAAQEWQTSCFSVTSNAAPLLVVDQCFELQRAYDLWYRTWGQVLGAERRVALLEVELHAAHKDLPKRLGSRPALYDRSSGRIVASVEAQGLPGLLRHELSHQLLWANWVVGGSAEPPAWLDEGLAEFFAAQAAVEFGSGPAVNRLRHLELLRGEVLPLKLEELMVATSDHFADPTRGALLYAGSHLLVDYLETGEHGALQAPFNAWLVKQSTSGTPHGMHLDLLAALRRSADELERGWRAHVQAAREE